MNPTEPGRLNRKTQAGGRSPRKSGLYKSGFRQEEIAALDSQPAQDIQAEIDLLRVTMRRTFAMVDENTDLKSMIDTLRSLSVAASRVGNLARIQVELHGEDNELTGQIHTSIREAMKGWPAAQ